MSSISSTNEIREAFLAYFEKHGHQRVASSPLVPGNDPTLLFTNAGMVQFKDVFLGDDKRDYVRATSSQRCVRAGGKHNDLENVGYTARHHTFFEMLGNFSFGDYFKKEAIPFAWNFLTDTLKIPVDKLWVTVYAEDDEAFEIWHKEIGLPEERIIRIGDNKGARYASDNFWSMGDTGPCGPCTEIFYDHGNHIEGGLPGTPEEDGDRYIEVWNIVFMQYNRSADGAMTELPKPSVDTGMGLERIAAVMQHVNSNYEIDLFKNLLDSTAEVLGIENNGQASLKVIADHIRSCAFLIVDGVMPSNEGRGYVLRRIIRRAIRHGHKLGVKDSFFWKLVQALINEMGAIYPELVSRREIIESALKKEEQQFALTLDQGMKILEAEILSVGSNQSSGVLSGNVAFKLYDTYGFPLDLTADIAREHQLTIDNEAYEAAMQQQRDKAKAASQFKSGALQKLEIDSDKINETDFDGYKALSLSSKVQQIFVNDVAVNDARVNEEIVLLLDKTPFYAESGGQAGDSGWLKNSDASLQVFDTQKQGEFFLHKAKVIKGQISVGDTLEANVDEPKRKATALNHSATHLLHAALRQVLGEHVTQKGSLVDDEKLRFDFSHHQPVSETELEDIHQLVNQQIRENTPVDVSEMDMESAKAAGAMALFGEKYGDSVRVLSMGKDRFSVELCGGTHVDRTGDIGVFRISSESGIASGVRRIEAVTGAHALDAIKQVDDSIDKAARLLKTNAGDLLPKIEQMLEGQKALERKLLTLQQKLASSAGSDIAGKAENINDVSVLLEKLTDVDPKALRDLVDQLKQQLKSCVVVLAVADADKIALVAGVSKDLVNTIKAGDIIKSLAAKVDGKGGGRPDFAQGGGTNLAALDDALISEKETIVQSIS